MNPGTRSVIFDLNGTLVPLASPEATRLNLSECANVLGMDAAVFIRCWNATFLERNSGAWGTTTEQFIYRLLESLGVDAIEGSVNKAASLRRQFAHETVRPTDEACQVLEALRARGVAIGLVSVCGVTLVEVWSSLSVSQMVDSRYLSAETGILKPDPRTYLTVCAELGCDPAQSLFVGDGAGGELEGAEAAGIEAVLLVNEASEQAGFAPTSWTGRRIASLTEVLGLHWAGGSNDER